MRETAAEWLDREALATHISVRVDHLPKLQRSGKLPAPSYHMGPKSPRWSRHAVDEMFTGEPAAPAKPTAEQITANVVHSILTGRSRRSSH